MYNSAKLNVVEKNHPFFWKGELTSALVKYFLEMHAECGFIIADPFAGSGIVLLESLKKDLEVIGCDINPAAYTLAKFFDNGALTYSEKWDLCQTVVRSIPWASLPMNKPVYQAKNPLISSKGYEYLLDFARTAIHTCTTQSQLVFVLNVLFKMENYKKLDLEQAWHHAYQQISSFLFSLPESRSSSSMLLSDARNLPRQLRNKIGRRKIDLIITNPPSLNAFNYHQNHRLMMELLDFDLSLVARSAFGSNKKNNEENLFFTVIQYCLDMAQTFSSLRQLISEEGMLIMTITRQANINNTTFYNGKMIKDICKQTRLFQLADESQRLVNSKTGITVDEEVLTLEPNYLEGDIDESARRVAVFHLKQALSSVSVESVIFDIEQAIASVNNVSPSPIYQIMMNDGS